MTTKDKQSVLFELTQKSFEEIINEVSELQVSPCEPYDVPNEKQLSVIVGISGSVDGRILLETTMDDAKKITTYMNFGDPLESEDDVFMYLAEFANMYCGRTVTYMNDAFESKEMGITPPAIFSANDLSVITPHLVSQKSYYKTDAGNFIVDVGYRTGDDLDEF